MTIFKRLSLFQNSAWTIKLNDTQFFLFACELTQLVHKRLRKKWSLLLSLSSDPHYPGLSWLPHHETTVDTLCEWDIGPFTAYTYSIASVGVPWQIVGTHLYSRVNRGTAVRVKCLLSHVLTPLGLTPDLLTLIPVCDHWATHFPTNFLNWYDISH